MIRELKQADLTSVMQIWLDANKEAHAFVPASYWESQFDLVKELISQAEVYVFEDGKEPGIQGFIGLADGFVAGLFMRVEHRSQGIGRQLLDHAKKPYSSLSLTVYQKNVRAIAFYEREGFQETGRRIDEATAEPELVMEWYR